jgi:hypothetical protein
MKGVRAHMTEIEVEKAVRQSENENECRKERHTGKGMLEKGLLRKRKENREKRQVDSERKAMKVGKPDKKKKVK